MELHNEFLVHLDEHLVEHIYTVEKKKINMWALRLFQNCLQWKTLR